MRIPTGQRPFPISRPAIPAALLLIAGILLGAGISGHTTILWITAAIILAGLVQGLIRNRMAGPIPLIALVATGYLAISPWLVKDHGPNHISHYLDSGYWWIEGTVITLQPAPQPDRLRVVMAVNTLSRKDITHMIHGRIRLTISGEPALSPGHGIRFFGQIRSFRNFENPGGFDYRRYMTFQGIYGSTWTSQERIQIRAAETADPMQWIQHIRAHLCRLMEKAGTTADPDAVAVLKALVYGNQSGIHAELRDRFNRSGVGHLLSISGLHVAIVATVAFAGFRWLFSMVPGLLWRGWGRPCAAVASLFPVVTYGILAGMEPATQRAVIMVALFLLSLLVGRRHDTLNTLFVAALIMLIVFPPALFSVSFQLSFSAMLAIVYGMKKISLSEPTEPKQSVFRKMVAWLKNAVLCSILAISGVMPITLMYFNEISLVGVIANVVLIPLAGSVAVPLGLLASLVSCVSDSAAIWGFRLTLMILEVSLMGVEGFANFPFASIKTITPSVLEVILYGFFIWSLLNLRPQRSARWILAAVLVLAVVDSGYWIRHRFFHPDLRVTAIDVGQGNATLLELPGGSVMMVDGGGFPDNVGFDVGKQILAPLLWQKKIATVDILALSHPDADHLNGLIYLARHFGVRELWTTHDEADTQGYRDLMEVCTEQNIRIRRMSTDTEKITLKGVEFQIFNPPPDFFDEPAKSRPPGIQQSRNNGSLVLKATFGKTAFLFTGDISAWVEREMAEKIGPEALNSTVLFVPHHGSQTSSSAELIQAVVPSVAVVSAGRDNPFGFPHPEVVERYHQAHSRMVCTCTHGAVFMKTNGRMLTLLTWMDPET
ncbi:DNA internalization-related competence protein ComEC/Rec2 [Desulfosarcina sp. OttesenSCG-928-A07]|nr:DNA internalization-related competence protein ComEC/Rec2 [Desulfosarcina sp. OttesenSCG-928-G17]MDL2329223.1 DNA internalization-related competence protein ComEC/Rec2 [Desulfosarcina sp. OttesenSCG-928-A07]